MFCFKYSWVTGSICTMYQNGGENPHWVELCWLKVWSSVWNSQRAAAHPSGSPCFFVHNVNTEAQDLLMISCCYTVHYWTTHQVHWWGGWSLKSLHSAHIRSSTLCQGMPLYTSCRKSNQINLSILTAPAFQFSLLSHVQWKAFACYLVSRKIHDYKQAIYSVNNI